MDDMLERMARAAYAADWPKPLHNSWEEAPPDLRERYTAIARAVLAAMREPTPGMVEAGNSTAGMPWSSVVPPGVDEGEYVIRMVYTAMIDAVDAGFPTSPGLTNTDSPET